MRGAVLANRELGMNVSGPGATNPTRTVEVLDRQINIFLPAIRETYEHLRMQDPALMGSLDVTMTIEANGSVSEVRFPVKRVSNDKLVSTVFDQMRNWVFPQAEVEAQLRFAMLFIPPGMDEASILLWEKRLGSRPVMEKPNEVAAPVAVASAHPPEREVGGTAPESRHEGPATAPPPKLAPLTRVQPSPESAPTSRGRSGEEAITGWYRVLYPTVLRSEPNESAKVVTRLSKGTRVRVVRLVREKWLEVRSVSDRPPGYLWWEDAMAEREEQAERR
jgi:hypothetical protein